MVPTDNFSKALERLRAWVAWQPLKQNALAKQLGCHNSVLSRVLSGERNPGLHFVLAVERESKGWPKGPIRPAEWPPVKRAPPTSTKKRRKAA